MRGFLRGRSGQTTAAGVVLVLLLVVVTSFLTDGLALLTTRQRCLEVASSAALRGASLGRDWNTYLITGQMLLDETTARSEALTTVDAGLEDLSLIDYTTRVEVIPGPDGGSIPDFPPGKTWSASEPGVGVYIEARVNTVWMGLVNGGGPVVVHAFAAAGVTEE